MTAIPAVLPGWPGRRGQDCRAHDDDTATWADEFATWEDALYSWTGEGPGHRLVFGPSHDFKRPSDCVITNGVMQVTVGAAESIPHVHVQAGHDGEWKDYGLLGFVHPDSTSEILGARLIRVTPDVVTAAIDATEIGTVFATLHRGERMVRVQHGDPLHGLAIARRIYWLGDDIEAPWPAGAPPVDGRRHQFSAVHGYTRALAALGELEPLPAGPVLGLQATAAVVTFGAYLFSAGSQDDFEAVHRQFAGLSGQEARVR